MSQSEEQAKKPETACRCPLGDLAEMILGKNAHQKARGHFTAARREVLLGVKALIEERLESLAPKEKPPDERVSKIVVE